MLRVARLAQAIGDGLATSGAVAVLAHPLTQRGELPVSPLVLALGAVYVLIAVAAVAARRSRDDSTHPAEAPRSYRPDAIPPGAMGTAAFWVARGVGLVLFILAMVAGRLGDPSQIRNVAPALTVGAGWPMLTLGSLVLGQVWWWVNPYDTLARCVAPLGAGEGSDEGFGTAWGPVWWSVAPAVMWMLWLTVWPGALAPRSIGAALIVYTFITLAGCLAVGRRTWLWRAEFFTVFFGLLAAVRTKGTGWSPPAGAPALLGVVCGGALFGLFRDSDLGAFLAYGPRANLYSGIAVVAFMAAAGLAAERGARLALPASVAVGLAPMAGVLVVALAIARNRLTTSLQLLPIVASDPLGGGLDLFGTRFNALNTQPLGEVGPVWLQAGLLLAGSVAGLLLARRVAAKPPAAGGGDGSSPRRTSRVVLGLLATLLGVGVAATAAI